MIQRHFPISFSLTLIIVLVIQITFNLIVVSSTSWLINDNTDTLPTIPSTIPKIPMPVSQTLRASKDTMIWSSDPSTPFGIDDKLFVGTFRNRVGVSTLTYFYYSAIGFELTEKVPPGSTVLSAKLQLTVKELDTSYYVLVSIHSLTSEFSEISTWDELYNKWYPIALATRAFRKGIESEGTAVEFDVTSHVKDVIERGQRFFGFMLVGSPPSSSVGREIVYFYSREAARQDWAPTLTVTYYSPTLTLEANPSTLQLRPGESRRVQLSVGGNYGDVVGLILDHPLGVIDYVLSPSRGRPPFTADLTVTARDYAPSGNYVIKVTARNMVGQYSLSTKIEIPLAISGGTGPPPPPPPVKIPLPISPIKIPLQQGGFDFSLSISPQTASVRQGETTSFSISAKVTSDFSGDIALSVSGLPPGSDCSASGNVLRIATSSSTPLGSYTITVIGQGGGKTHSATASLEVKSAEATVTTSAETTKKEPTFMISLPESSIKLRRGGQVSLRVSVTGLYGFSEPVTVSLANLPQGVSLTSEFKSPPNFTATLTLSSSLSAPIGTHTITLIAKGGELTRSSTVSLSVIEAEAPAQQTATNIPPETSSEVRRAEFSISVFPNNLSINAGSSGSVAVTIEWLQGSGTVELEASGLPPDAEAKFNPAELEEGTSSLVIKAGSTTGAFTVIVSGRSGNLTKSEAFQLQITSGESRCVIATASFGSELSPQVSLLRDFRDEVVMSTYSGSRFMAAFNSFYYSWSPGVAEVIRRNPSLASITRALISPLLATISAGTEIRKLSINEELSVILMGIFVSSVLGLIYLAPPLLLLSIKFKPVNWKTVRFLFSMLLLSSLMLPLGIISFSDILTMISSSALVLSNLLLVPCYLSHLVSVRRSSS